MSRLPLKYTIDYNPHVLYDNEVINDTIDMNEKLEIIIRRLDTIEKIVAMNNSLLSRLNNI